jgi:hypothetical protein
MTSGFAEQRNVCVRRIFKDYAVKLFKTSELPQLVDEI